MVNMGSFFKETRPGEKKIFGMSSDYFRYGYSAALISALAVFKYVSLRLTVVI